MAGAAPAEAEGLAPAEGTSDVGGGADISVGCFGWREAEKTACEIRMAAPPEEFFQGLEKYFANDLEGAKKTLSGDDLFSKSLLILVDVKADDGSNNDEIQARIDGMDFKGNDIALMFCVLAQEYGMHMTKGHNLLLKRFGKEEKIIQKEEEMPQLEAAAPAPAVPTPAAPAPAVPTPAAPAPAAPTPAPVNQTGGKRKTRKATSSSLQPKKRRVSRGKA